MNAAEWIAAYGRAWVERDPEAAVALFTEDAVYRSSPFREPHTGSDGIREYWTRATSTQEDLDLRFGAPVVEGRKAVVEWWAIMRDEGAWITLPGLEDGRREPPPGWGR
jgi:SnoaL-like domain